MMTLNTIVEGCRRNKAECQRELVVRFSPKLMTIARRYAPDNATAQDILQDALIRILKHIKQLKNTDSLEGWMRRIIISIALNHLDKKWIRREVSMAVIQHDDYQEPAVLSQLATEKIMECICQLPDGYRQIFNLYAIEGYKHREIGQLIGISESSSRSQYARARAQLQTILAQHKIGLRHVK